MCFGKNETFKIIFSGEFAAQSLPMFPNPFREIGRGANIQCSMAPVRHDVDKRLFGHGCLKVWNPAYAGVSNMAEELILSKFLRKQESRIK